MQRFRLVYIYHESLAYQENTIDSWDIYLYATQEHCITILFTAAHDGNVWGNTDEHTSASLYSDWLFFLWQLI